MRNLFLLLLVVANAYIVNAEVFTVRLHIKENATKENIPVECTLIKSTGAGPGKYEHMNHIVEKKGEGEFELEFDKRPEEKDMYHLYITPYHTDGRVTHRQKNMSIEVPKGAKSPYDIDVMIWGIDEYMHFDPAKSFTVIVHAKDSLTNEPISTYSYVNLSKCKNWEELADWKAMVKKTENDGVIKITFMKRPKADEKWELNIWGRSDANGEREFKSVPIKIPKKAKSPYRMPDVLMPGPGVRAN